MYAHNVLDEFDSGSNWIRTSGVTCPWICKNCWIWLCLHSIIYRYWPISTKLGQNVCDHKMSDEFDYGSNQTKTARVICPWIKTNLPYFTLFTLVSANVDQWIPNLATVFMPMRSRMSFDYGTIELEHPELFALEFGKIAESDFIYTLASTNVDQLVPNVVTIYMTMISWMSLIISQILQ